MATDTEVSAVSAQIPGNVAGKNAVINGAFDIWQRGTSFTPGGGTTYSADRYFHYWDGNGSHTISRQTFTPGSAPVAGYEGQYFFRHQQTTAGTGGTYMAVIGQLIEDVRTLAGQTVTFSFWAKADAARSYSYFFDQGFGTGGSASVNAAALTVPMTTSWQRFSYTFNMPSVSGKTIGPNSSLSVRMDSNAVNTTQTIDIWGIQLEAGSVATPFSRAGGDIQGELAKCQRYYYRTTAGDNFATMGIMGVGQTSTTAEFFLQLPVTMRTKPTSVDFSAIRIADGTNISAITSVTMNTAQSTVNVAHLNFSAASGIVQYRIYNVSANNNSAAFLGVSAEL
jgi:hypothetical protein